MKNLVIVPRGVETINLIVRLEQKKSFKVNKSDHNIYIKFLVMGSQVERSIVNCPGNSWGNLIKIAVSFSLINLIERKIPCHFSKETREERIIEWHHTSLNCRLLISLQVQKVQFCFMLKSIFHFFLNFDCMKLQHVTIFFMILEKINFKLFKVVRIWAASLIVIAWINLFIWSSRLLLHTIINIFFPSNEYCKVKNLISNSAYREINNVKRWFWGKNVVKEGKIPVNKIQSFNKVRENFLFIRSVFFAHFDEKKECAFIFEETIGKFYKGVGINEQGLNLKKSKPLHFLPLSFSRTAIYLKTRDNMR